MRRCDVGGSGESMSVRIYLQQRRLAALLCFFVFFFFFNGKSAGSFLTDCYVQRPNGRCAGSGPKTAASVCSSSLALWVGASSSHLQRKETLGMALCTHTHTHTLKILCVHNQVFLLLQRFA